jgi:uncharacterized protein
MTSAEPLRLENRFSVPASPDAAWTLLNDVPNVIPCLPGTELLGVMSANTWRAKMLVNVGPVGLQFDAEVRRIATHHANRSLVLVVDAREAHGRGGAHATVRSDVSGDAAEATVVVATELTFDGAVAELAVGPVVSDIARQLTRRFAQSLAALIESGSRSETKPIGALRLGLWAFVRVLLRR